MASLENLKNMYDVSLKPRILLTMLKEDIPDEKKPLGDSLRLSSVVSTVQSLKLLSESFSTSMDAKLIERWKSAVNDWFDRLLSLVTNTSMPDKCWAGICLLGLSCQECSSDRFLSSYALWFDKLLWHIQQSPVDSELVKAASLASLSDLVTRLAGLPNTKKDGTSSASKLIQPILKLLQEDNKESVWEGAIHLLCTIINNFPASLHRHFDSTEAVMASKFFSGKCSGNVLKKLAYCLALLPKSRGDADSWIAMLRKILLLVNGYLTDIFHDLEEETRWDEAVRLLVPPGEATPTSIWGQTLLEESSDKAQKRSKIASVAILILSCCTMLTTSYPVQVTVPIRSLLALVERVLMVDGSPPRTMSAFVIATEQAFVCSELPALHSSSLELLTAVIKGMRSQLLPHVAYVVRLAKEYFRRCQLPDLRIKMYSITKILLFDRGVGIAILLAQEVVNNATLDLVAGCEDTSFSANLPSSEALLPTSNRKRKLGASGQPEQNNDHINLGVEGPGTCATSLISVKIASLEALEALLNVGGALRSDAWRPKIDNLLITIAADSCKGGWANEQRNSFLPNVSTSTYADLQLAAFRALLVSLLSRSRTRPPHLAQSLELFRRGRQETGTKLSEFCCHAQLTLEVLIHPRALPLANFQSVNSRDKKDGFKETLYSGGQNQNPQFSTRMQEVRRGSHDSDDDLYESWLGAGKETDAQVDGPDENINKEKPSQNSVLQSAEKITAGGFGDNMMVESRSIQDSVMQPQELVSSKGAAISEVADDPQFKKIKSTMSTLKTDALVSTSNEMAAVEALTADIGGETAPQIGDTRTKSNTAKSNTFASELDEDSSSDSMPDIVEAEPDSD